MTENISAIVASSMSWDDESAAKQPPADERIKLCDEALVWQQMSQHASDAENFGSGLPTFPTRYIKDGEAVDVPRGKVPREYNRIVETLGLMGAVGEQLGLAYSFERDVQRFVATAKDRMPDHQRLIQRALAEAVGYYTLGASHSLGNLVLRLLLLNEAAAAMLAKDYPKAAGFPTLSDEKEAWVSLNHDLSKALGRAERASGNQPMTTAVDGVRGLERSDGFRDLEARRGMDYHRRRPQSLPHTSPHKPVVRQEEGYIVMTSFAPRLQPEADADRVHAIVLAGMKELGRAMTAVRLALPDAIRGEGITFVTT